MARISLRDYQVEAVRFTQKVDKSLLCMRVGSGKTVCAMFAIREFINRKQIDKAMIVCTKSSVSVFKKDFHEKAGIDVPIYETEREVIDFLRGKGKICLLKHSIFEKLGKDIVTIRILEEITMNEGIRIGLIVDEAHKIQNPEGVAQDAYHRIDFLFDRVLLYTATPYSSCLSQFWGLICLIYPKLWPSKRRFFDRFIDEIAIHDPKTRRVIRKEKVRYRNLKEFRKTIEPFTYFYYPAIPLVHLEHHTRLKDYTKYDDLCKSTIEGYADRMNEDKEKE